MQDSNKTSANKSKVVKLKVIRNKKIREEKLNGSKSLIASAKRLAADKEITGYAIVAWGANDLETSSWYSANEFIPERMLPIYVKEILTAHIAGALGSHATHDLEDNPE